MGVLDFLLSEKIAILGKLRRWARSNLSILALCLIATPLLSACYGGPQSTDVAAVPTSVLTPTTTHAPELIKATGPNVVDRSAVRVTGSPDPMGVLMSEGGAAPRRRSRLRGCSIPWTDGRSLKAPLWLSRCSRIQSEVMADAIGLEDQ